MDKAGALAAKDLLVEHVGGAAFGDMLDEDGLLDVLIAVGNDGAGQSCRSAFTDETHVDVADGMSGFQRDVNEVKGALSVLLNVEFKRVFGSGGHIEEKRGVERGALLYYYIDVVFAGRKLQELRCALAFWDYDLVHRILFVNNSKGAKGSP